MYSNLGVFYGKSKVEISNKRYINITVDQNYYFHLQDVYFIITQAKIQWQFLIVKANLKGFNIKIDSLSIIYKYVIRDNDKRSKEFVSQYYSI